MSDSLDLPEFARRETVKMLVGSVETNCTVAYPRNVTQCRQTLEYCRANELSACPRGSGRSYGDAILNDREMLIDMSRMNRIVEFAPESGRVTVEAGARITDILREYHHLGFTVAASPTDSTISVGGAMAANVNGKESWRIGNFGDQIVSFKLLTAAGEILTVDSQTDPALFHAVIGGMGLLGLVVEVTLQLVKIPSPFLQVSITTADNLAALIAKLGELKHTADFIVVWVDAYARRESVGQSVIHATRWLPSEQSPAQLKDIVEAGIERLAIQRRRAIAFFNASRAFINLGFEFQRIAVRLFNAFYFNLHKARSRGRTPFSGEAKPELFVAHNFDKSYIVPPPDILCGPRGYTIQVTIPYEHGFEAMREMLVQCERMLCPPATTILRLHRRDAHMISFSEDGYSLNFEFHPKRRHERAMHESIRALIDCAASYGGKVHLPKDSVLSREQFERIFPRHCKFMELKRRLDPAELFQSDMYRRLFAGRSAAEP